MPELPEVEVTRRGLRPCVKGKLIKSTWFSGKKMRFETSQEKLDRWIRGSKILKIDRRGKYLIFRLNKDAVMLIHLGMSGRIGIFDSGRQVAHHDHLILSLEGELDIRLNDSRRFGGVIVWSPEEQTAREAEFMSFTGIEPLDETFSGTELSRLARGRRRPVKQFLMDSRLIAGIGNIYANEALFLAGINPGTPVNLLKGAAWETLASCCKKVLEAGIAAGGTTISDFLSASGESGYFQLQLNVYGRDNQSCKRCGKKIQRTLIGGRATFSCSGCQVTTGQPAKDRNRPSYCIP